MNCAQDFKDIQTEMATIVYNKILKHDVEIEFDYFRIDAKDSIISLNEPELPIDSLPIPENISKIEKLLKNNQDKFVQAYSIVFLVVDDDNMFYDGKLCLEYIIDDGVMNPIPNVVFSATPGKTKEVTKAHKTAIKETPKTAANKAPPKAYKTAANKTPKAPKVYETAANKGPSKKDIVEEIVANKMADKKFYNNLVSSAYNTKNNKDEGKIEKPKNVYTMKIHEKIIRKIVEEFVTFDESHEDLTEKKFDEMIDDANLAIRKELWKGYSDKDEDEIEADFDGQQQYIHDMIFKFCLTLAKNLGIRNDDFWLFPGL